MLNLAGLNEALPTQAISRLVGILGRTEIEPISQAFVRAFAWHYEVDLGEAERGSLESTGRSTTSSREASRPTRGQCRRTNERLSARRTAT